MTQKAKTLRLREPVDVVVGRKMLPNLDPEQRQNLRLYLDSVVEGWTDVLYTLEVYGRYKAQLVSSSENVPTYTTMYCQVRNLLCRAYVHDVDMVNAGPSIMNQSFMKFGLASPRLTEYIQTRDTRLQEIMDSFDVDRRAAKALIISMMNHGKAQSWVETYASGKTLPGWVLDLEKELHMNIETLLERRPDFQRVDKWIGSQISAFYFHEERRCLDALVAAIRKSRYKVTSLIHDGAHVMRKITGSSDFLDERLLRKWEEAIYDATGYTLRLTEKPFEVDLSLLAENPQGMAETKQPLMIDHARKLLKILNRQRADSQKTWKELGRVLHSFGDELLQDWIRFSRKSATFREGACEALWSTFTRPDQPELATLQQWAKKDSPEVFVTSVPSEVLNLWDKGDRGLAEIAHMNLKDVIKLPSSRGRREYYYFDTEACLWKKVSDGTIKVVISRALEQQLGEVVSHFLHKARQCEHEMEKKTFDTKAQSAQKVISYILNNHGLASVVALASDMFLDTAFEEQLDQVPYLIGVRNGVVDLRTGLLRSRTPEDMIYNVLDINYDPDVDTSFIHSTVKKSMVDDEELTQFVQRLLGYGITGEQCEEIFVIFNGAGRNGKGLLMQTLSRLLKGFYDEISCAVVACREAANLDAERAKLQGLRIACFNELKEGDKLRTDQVQLLSGGDGIPACAKYKDPITIRPRHLCIMTTNHLPEISEVIPAIIARLIVVEFPVEFRDSLEGCDNDPKKKLKDPDMKRKFEENLPAFFRWLVVGAVEWYKRKDLKKGAPEAVKAYTQKYLTSQDKIQEFIDKCCEVGKDHFFPYRDFIREYEEFTQGEKLNAKILKSMLESKGYLYKSRMIDNVKHRGYEGIKLKEEAGTGGTEQR